MTEKVVVNSETGEVSQFKFLTMWTGREKTGLDYSRKTEKRFKEVPPYAVDLDGKIINKKSVPVLVEDEPFDVDEYIQSFKDETDIYTILEKFAMTGCTDTTLINKGVMYSCSVRTTMAISSSRKRSARRIFSAAFMTQKPPAKEYREEPGCRAQSCLR